MIKNQGEIAVIVEQNAQGEYMITHVNKPRKDNTFQKDEIRDLFLAQAVSSNNWQDKEREQVGTYLSQAYSEREVDKQARGVFGLQEVQIDRDKISAQVFVTKKYKPVALKVKPVLQALPSQYRIKREIVGDPLAEMAPLSTTPAMFEPTGRYTEERMRKINESHKDFLWPEELKLTHHLMMLQEGAFAWDDSERGSFREDFFPPIEIPVIPHTPWVLKNIPIPPGTYQEVCRIIRSKIEAGVYEPSNSAYRSRWFCVLKKDGKSLRLVHSLEPLNAVTIAHSGLPPATEELASHFAGRSCGGVFDLYVGYDERVLAESSRDMTTFQTPYGALRLVTLPMGWTNSVPIFHDDVTYILRAEIPDVTMPYIDDVPVRGPLTRYELPGGGFETIPENSGIRRFVWEHLQNVNRVLQHMKYSGGTFSGPKTLVCVGEFMVVGHLCTYEGRKPATDRIGVILRWGPCKDKSETRAFLGTLGTFRTYIEMYAHIANPIQKLVRDNEPFVWGTDQDLCQMLLKDMLLKAPALFPPRYDVDWTMYLAVDTSWIAMGCYLYQIDPAFPNIKRYHRFDSIPLKPREARFSQPKRELFGLKLALEHCKFWLLGVRRLVVETDAKYIHGMLNNPSMGPNATINRWIESILMFHFELRHRPGKGFGPDGLSRRPPQEGDPEYERSPEDLVDYTDPPSFVQMNPEDPPPLDFEDFKHEIDTRGGYSLQEATSVSDFHEDLARARSESVLYRTRVQEYMNNRQFGSKQAVFIQQFVLDIDIPNADEVVDMEKDEEYPESHRTREGILQDDRLPAIREWLKGDLSTPEGMSSKEVKNFVRMSGNFFTDKDGRLYRRSVDSAHKLVVEKGKRMQMLRAAHDALGHRGAYATKQLLVQRFWWPEMERDVNWYVRTCHLCQERQKTLLRIPPTITHTPSLFQVLHADTLHMTPKSNGCGYIVHGRCALSSWMEGRPLRQETGKSIGQWLFEEIICRWGCLMEIVTDNGKPFIAATAWLEQKYGIKGIKISPYNSRANGKIERPHWDVRQMLYKATDGHTNKWFWFFYHVMWADRISVRKGLGCSPYFIATGAHPILPLDLQEATWLVQLPDRILTTEELIGYRARALAKHREHVEEMRIRIDKAKKDAAFRYYMEHVATIKTYTFVPGDLILIRNTEIEQSLNKKMKPRYLGPMVVVSRTRGGAYIVCEMDGSVWQQKVAAFRAIPYFARKSVPLPEGIQKIIDLSPEGLKKLEELPDPADGQEDRDYSFDGVVLGKDGGDELQEDQEYNSEDSDNEEVSGFPARRVLRPRRS